MRSFTATLSARAAAAVLAATLLAACASSGSSSTTRAASATTVTTVTRTSPQSSASTTSTATSSTPTSTASGPPPCRAAGLALSFLGQQGATGHGELGFSLRNTLGTSCSTIGYPGIQFLSSTGALLPTTPTHTTNDFFGHSPLHALVLGPGQTASFRLGVTHGIASSAGCTTAYGLRVIPPNDTATLHVSVAGGATECGTATVSPLQAGSSAYH